MVRLKQVAELVDRLRRSILVPLGHWIFATVNLPFQGFRVVAGSSDCPIAKVSDCDPALSAAHTVVDDERLGSRCGSPNGETLHVGIVCKSVPGGRSREFTHHAIGKPLRHGIDPVSALCPVSLWC